MSRLWLSLFCLLISSCYPYSSAPQLCDEIPEGGCPTGRGGTCDDPLCQALYDCIDGAWQKTEACSGAASGGGTTSTTGSGGDSGGGGGCTQGGGAGGSGCTPVMIDHSGEQAGCMPDLQPPDCPAAAAEQCAESACLTGCDGFFLCTKDGWAEVAYCDAESCELIVASP